MTTRKTSVLLALAIDANNFYFGAFKMKTFTPFMCSGNQVGLISPQVVEQLKSYQDVFKISDDFVTLDPKLSSYEERSQAIGNVLADLKARDIFLALRGWRNECYEIKSAFSDPALFEMERSATPLLGVRTFGIHINGFVNHPENGPSLWFQRRSDTKQTWPGMLDSFVGGGLSVGYGILETAIKESQEEANVPEEIALRMKPAGSVSFFYDQGERGIHPQTEFVFDLELPHEFSPSNNDGEVSQ